MAEIRFGQIGRLKNDRIQEYTELHAAVWPEIKELIKECNLKNYSIFIKDDLVFSYFEYTGVDYEADMKKMAENKTNQKWWGCTRPCFDKYSESSLEAFYENMKSIFFLE